MTGEEKLSQAYYQPDRLWTGNKAIKELHKITSMSRKDIKSWLARQALWQVHTPLPREIHNPHYDATKPNEQHQFDLVHMPHNVFEGNTYRHLLAGIDVASRYGVAKPFTTKKSIEVVFMLKAIYKKGGAFKYPKVLQIDNGSEFEGEVTELLEKIALRFKEQQQNTSIPLRPLWKPSTKSCKNCCLNQWILKSFRTLKEI